MDGGVVEEALARGQDGEAGEVFWGSILAWWARQFDGREDADAAGKVLRLSFVGSMGLWCLEACNFLQTSRHCIEKRPSR